ncbi:MAG TPA: phosphonate dehydrogenase [Candidatus Angelobacter sp.]|nr:phosphonate dehydrogenase [Candidatus Angelobacter sp.]
MSRPRVVLTHRVHDPVKQLLARHCEVVSNDTLESWPHAKLLEEARNAEGLLVFMPDKIDESFLTHCPRLKVIAAALKGYDNIDLAASSRRGVWVTVVPDLLSQPTAELAIALTLGLVRNVAAGDRLIRSGRFHGWRPVLYGGGLAGKTVGVIGMGRVGQAFARVLAGFNCRIIYHDPVHMSPVQEAFLGMGRASLDQVLAESDVLVVLVPLTASSLHMIGDEALARMKPGSYLVNVGRGSVVDEAAVARALDRGHLAGFAADVFEMEDWARPGHPAAIHPSLLATADRTLFTPHLGSAVAKTRLEIEMSAAESILQALRGERPRDAINEIEPAARKAEK